MRENERQFLDRRKNAKQHGARIAFAGLLALVVSSCAQMLPGLGKLEDATLAVYPLRATGDLGSGLEAFNTLIAPLIAESKCTSCHATQQPTIAAGDPEVAYAAAKLRMSATTPSTSTLISKSQDNHCGGCPTASKNEWIAAVEQWAEIENATAGTGGTGGNPPNPVPTFTMPPVDVGSPPVFVTATQQLTGAGGNNRSISLAARAAGLAGVNLLFDLQDPYPLVANTARIFNLRLQNNSAGYILVRGIRLFQSVDATITPTDPNDYKSDVGSVFTDVDVVVYPNTTLRLSFAEALMSKVASEGLYYAFGFQALEVTNAPSCKNLAAFGVVNNMLSAKCTACHNAGGPGSGGWTFAADATARCGQSLQRVELVTPISSKLIQQPFFRANNHPATGMNQADVDNVVNWITLER